MRIPAPRHWRLLPDDPHTGWLPYAWLTYLASFLALPAVRLADGRLSAGGAAATLLALAVFLASYFRGYWVRGRGLVAVAAVQVALGVAFVPGNAGAFVFFVYAAGFAGQLERRAGPAIGAVAAVCGATLGAVGASHALGIAAPLLCGLIGAVNLHQVRTRRDTARLVHAQGQVRHLAAVAERERIARDLHDLLGHTLSLIVLKSELAAKLAPRDAERAAREMRDVEAVSRQALQQVRETLRGYRASLADEIAQSRSILDAAGIRAEFSTAPAPVHRASEEALALALREAVTNVVRHAGAASCRVSLRAERGECLLEVEDDGGFRAGPEGSGLRGMRERVEALDGRVVRTEGAGGRGTRLEVRVPCAEGAR